MKRLYGRLDNVLIKALFLLLVLFLRVFASVYPWFSPFFINRKKSRLLFLEVLPKDNAGYYYRVQGWKEIAERRGFQVYTRFLQIDRHKFENHLENRRYFFLFYTLWKRFLQILDASKFDCIIVRRELLLYNDFGNLFLEKLLLRLNNRVILDFDDDISAAKREPRKVQSLVGKLFAENGNKFTDSLLLYPGFFPCSEYLKNKLKLVRPSIVDSQIAIIPTCVDYDKYDPKHYTEVIRPLTLGWIGGTRNLSQLDILHEHLNALIDKGYEFELLVISGREYAKRGASYKIRNVAWDPDSQINSIRQIDVGLMPLVDTPQTRGKCALKLLQYMGLGIPGVASAITVNCDIIDDGDNGWLVTNPDEWSQVLELVFLKRDKLPEIGVRAREKVMQHFTFRANEDQYFQLINHIIEN